MEKMKKLSGLEISSLCGLILELNETDVEKIITKLTKSINENRDKIMRNWVRRLNES